MSINKKVTKFDHEALTFNIEIHFNGKKYNLANIKALLVDCMIIHEKTTFLFTLV